MPRITRKQESKKSGRSRVRLKADPDRALAACAAERVRFARTKAGLSQETLAKRAGIARPNVARLEAGRHLPSLSTLRRVADALGIALAFLVTLPDGDPEDRAIAESGLTQWRDELDRQDRKR
jgi:transcriptional regulator with XRE-family HTH domain